MRTRRPSSDLERIRRELADRAEALFLYLYGKPTTRRRDQLRWGRKESLVLHFRGRKGPWWYDHEAQQGGADLLGAIQHNQGLHFPGAVDFARAWLGHEDERPQRPVRQRTILKPVDYDAELADKARRVNDLVVALKPITGITEKYLREHRAIDAEAWPETLGSVDAATVQRCTGWWWWRWPALVVEATNAAGAVTGLQLIAIEQDGQAAKRWNSDGKLKQTFGMLRDAAVKLRGGDRALLLCEGPETALSCWCATGIETWATLGSIARASLDGVPIDRPIVVCADDDPRYAPSNKALRQVILKWRREGRTVLMVKPWRLTRRDKSDFNDLLRVLGRSAVRNRVFSVLNNRPASRHLPDVVETRHRTTELIGRAFDELLSAPSGDDDAPFKVVKVATCLGKTESAIRRAVVAAAGGAKILYLCPTHLLCSEVAGRIEAEARRQNVNVPVEIWRGRKQSRPDYPGETMCSELDVIEDAQAAKLDVSEICKACPSAPDCLYLAQQKKSATIWVCASDLLGNDRPKPMKGADLQIIDEDFTTRGLIGVELPIRISATEIASVPVVQSVTREADLQAELMPHRQVLAKAIQDHPLGGLTRENLVAAGLRAEIAREAAKLEWIPKALVKTDGVTWETVRRLVAKAAKQNRAIPRFVMLWRIVADLLTENGPRVSGRAVITEEEIEGAVVRTVKLSGAKEIASSWRRTPTLYLDATVNMRLLHCRVPHAELVGEVEAEAPHMRIVQYPDRAFGKTALQNERLLFKLWDWAVAYATRQGGDWAVILPKEAEAKVAARYSIPSFIRVHHFGAVRGLDELKDVRGLIVIGRPMPTLRAVEQMAGALSGGAVQAVEGDWYPAELVQIRARDGSQATVEADRHPDPLAEAVRASITEGELIQAIGRARGLNRTAENFVEIVLLTNVPVPGVTPDELRIWNRPSIDDELLARCGAVLECTGDAATVAGLTLRQVKDRRQRMDAESYKNDSYENASNLRRAEYQRAGPGRKPQRVVYDPRRIADCRAWLAEKLGPLVHFAELLPEGEQGAGDAVAASTIRSPSCEVDDELPPEVRDYAGGFMPPAVVAWTRARRRAAGLSEDEIARRIGLSRPQLANAEAQRFGLSQTTAARLLAEVGRLRPQ